MHFIKYNSLQVLNSYMFRHQGAILREFFLEQLNASPMCQSGYCITLIGMIRILKFLNIKLISIKLQCCGIKIM
jgi:hypothetical protein